jgi:hypothetical protein
VDKHVRWRDFQVSEADVGRSTGREDAHPALTKYKIGDSAVGLWDTKGIRPEWLKGNATDVVARFVMPMVNGLIKDGCQLHGEFNYDWESNEHRDSSACAGPNGGNWFWSSPQTLPNQHEFENKLNVILFVTPYIADSDERDTTQNFMTALFAELRLLGIELAVVITSMKHCSSKVLGCSQHDMEVMLNNAGLGIEGMIFLPRGNWDASTLMYQKHFSSPQMAILHDTHSATGKTFLQPDDIDKLVQMIRDTGYLWCTKNEKYEVRKTLNLFARWSSIVFLSFALFLLVLYGLRLQSKFISQRRPARSGFKRD